MLEPCAEIKAECDASRESIAAFLTESAACITVLSDDSAEASDEVSDAIDESIEVT